MATTILQTSIPASYSAPRSSVTLWSRFVHWCKGQQKNRLLWLGIILAGHGCILTPITILTVGLAGGSLTLFMMAMAAMGMSLVTNLAALPTKITLPVFFFSIAMDILVLAASFSIGLSTSVFH